MSRFFEIDLNSPDLFDSLEAVSSLLPKSDGKGEIIFLLTNSIGDTHKLMEEVVEACYKAGPGMSLFQTIVQNHLDLINRLGLKRIIDGTNDLFVDGEWTIEDTVLNSIEYTYDHLVPLGELAGSMILSEYLNSKNIANKFLDMRDYIKTTAEFGQAKILEEQTQNNFKGKLSQQGDLIYFIGQQHVGSTLDNLTTWVADELNWREGVQF